MSQDKLQFLKTIAQSPKEDTPRLVYADWLQETGVPTDYQRGELIRVQCEIGTTPPHRDIEAPILKSYLPITWASQSSTEPQQGTVLKSELKDLGLTTRSLVNIPQLKSPKGRLFIIASTSEIYDLGNPMTFNDRRRDGRIDIRVQQVDPKETNPEYLRLVERQDELIHELYGAAYLQRLQWERISRATGSNRHNETYRGEYNYNAFILDRGLASVAYVTADQMKTLLPGFCRNHPVTTVYLRNYDGPESCVTGSWPEELPFLEAVYLPRSIVEPYTRMYQNSPGICAMLHETLNRLKDRAVRVDVWDDRDFGNPYSGGNRRVYEPDTTHTASEIRRIFGLPEPEEVYDEDPYDHTSPDPTDWEGELRPEPAPPGDTNFNEDP